LIGILKTPLNTSDRLLIAILVTFVVKFSFDEVSLITGNRLYTAIAAVFGMSSIATCGWYIKYLTDTETGFGIKQLYIYLPLVIITIPLVILLPDATPGIGYDVGLSIVTALILYYFWFCIDMLQKHRKLILENYSGAPGSITVNWMMIIIALQIVEFFLKGVLPKFIKSYDNADITIITNEYCFIIITFLLVVLGIWQKSIPVFIPAKEDISQSVLHADDLKHYQLKVERFMDNAKPYLDPELTIEKLSDQMRMKKLLLSQTLNKGFDKNFFTFIKEYRVHYVETELKNESNKDRTIMDIAYMSGFNSKTGFNRAFKEVTGKTPTEYLEN
ncbi:MAG TPA: AraC family transcriptional regulator, partial [Mucilaginibacter sp.]|nr:AraC family transcriptional regulator [Mucilaginibacter sp.]